MKQNKKIIKLNENDMSRIVNYVLNEELNEMKLQSRLFDFLDKTYRECRKFSSRIFNKTWIYYNDVYFDNEYATIVIDEKDNVVIYDDTLPIYFEQESKMEIDEEIFNKIIVKWVEERFKIPVDRSIPASSNVIGSHLKMPR